MGHNTLENYYRTLWTMAYHHHFSIGDVEEMIPFERDIMIQLTMEHIKKEEEARNAL